MAPVRCRWSCAFGSSLRSRFVEGWFTQTVALLCGRLVAVTEAGLLADLRACDARGALHGWVIGDLAVGPHDLVVPAATGFRPQHVPDRGAQDERLHLSSPPNGWPLLSVHHPPVDSPVQGTRDRALELLLAGPRPAAILH